MTDRATTRGTHGQATIIREIEIDNGISFNERLTFAEAYALLIKEQKNFCDGLRTYALEKSGAKECPAKYHLSVGNGQKVVIKFVIKNGITVALFRLEDERLRRLRRSATSDGAEVKVKETEVPITDKVAYNTAKEMIDLRLVQLQEDIAYQKMRQAERRKAAREAAGTPKPPKY